MSAGSLVPTLLAWFTVLEDLTCLWVAELTCIIVNPIHTEQYNTRICIVQIEYVYTPAHSTLVYIVYPSYDEQGVGLYNEATNIS